MGVPATTGVLKNTIAEMEIGDYTIFGYDTSNSFKLNIYPMNGNMSGREVPIIGDRYNNNFYGWFAMIKVARGLLIADRVINHTINWDTLNVNKLIQGSPWDTGNTIPVMTSNTSPSGTASANSEYPSGEAFSAFNGVTNTGAWTTNSGTTGWLRYDFSSEVIISAYSLYSQATAPTRSPKNWTFEGSNDGILWDTLDTQTNITGWSDNIEKKFIFNNKKAYSKYRINVTLNNGDTSYLSIGEMKFYKTAGIIRSLTSGVAYADINGNAHANVNERQYGGFPINNEFNKYIINSDLNGTCIPDNVNVWHHDTWSWTQDTPSTILSAIYANPSAYRMVVGKSVNNEKIGANLSNFSGTQAGFRPVFEYNEI